MYASTEYSQPHLVWLNKKKEKEEKAVEKKANKKLNDGDRV